jgi:hypothetical protein
MCFSFSTLLVGIAMTLIVVVVNKVYRRHKCRHQKFIRWTIGPVKTKLDKTPFTPNSKPNIRFNRRIAMAKFVLTDAQEVTLSVSFVDKAGNPAPVDGAPVWAVSDATLFAITPAADGLSAVVSANGPLGSGQVSVSADADTGAGVTTIAGTLDIDVLASAAVSPVITAGVATAKP